MGDEVVQYKGIKVYQAGWLINLLSSKNSRGMALGWFILIRKPDAMGYVTSATGRKTLDRLLKHEYTHIERQQAMGVFKWFWKYWTDSWFKFDEERIALESEWRVE